MGGKNIGVGATMLSVNIGGAGGFRLAKDGCGNNIGGNLVLSPTVFGKCEWCGWCGCGASLPGRTLKPLNPPTLPSRDLGFLGPLSCCTAVGWVK